MWTFGSESRKRQVTLACLTALAVASLTFAWAQNAGWLPGGAIALPKLFWLTLVLFAWFVLPALISADPVLPRTLRRGHLVFWIGMVLRGVIEGWMIYGPKIWRPLYGITHDIASAAIVLWFARTRIPLLALHSRVIAASLVCEAAFARYFERNFKTMGYDATYFVPPGELYADILRATTAADVLLCAWLAFFLSRWLRSNDSSA